VKISGEWRVRLRVQESARKKFCEEQFRVPKSRCGKADGHGLGMVLKEKIEKVL